MLAKCHSGTVCGVDARTVEIEVCASDGAPQFTLVGLPDQAVKEAKDRVSTAIGNSGFKKIESNITVNLAPADVRKEGPIYDLPIAVGLLAATGKVRMPDLGEYALAGELALSGEVRRIQGILPIVLEMRRIGKRGILVPGENATEASVVDGISVYPVRTLREAVDFLAGTHKIEPVFADLETLVAAGREGGEDFADVKGQEGAKRALEVAVAGGHNILMIGSPGSGKTMLARRIPSILPPLTPEEALEVTRIHSVAGKLEGGCSLVTRRPFRAPHHTVSDCGLLGGGTHPQPGEVSLAHRGVLFLDEFPEFRRNVLEVMRQPLEDGHVAISRAAAACDFPSRFMLVAAMNPCPCGYYGCREHPCRCTTRNIMKYQSRVSGPLLDRIDIQIEVPAVPVKELPRMEPGEPSAEIRRRVLRARAIQAERYRDMPGVHTNADAKSRDLVRICHLSERERDDFIRLIERLNLSARAYDKVLRVARTLADLKGTEGVSADDLSGAVRFRRLDDEQSSFWA